LGLGQQSRGVTSEDHPGIYDDVIVIYTIKVNKKDEGKVKRAVDLSQDTYFSILFLPSEQKKINLCIFFLKNCREQVIKELGAGIDSLLQEKLSVLNDMFVDPEGNYSLEQMYSEADQLFSLLKYGNSENIGEKIFAISFEKTAEVFKDYEFLYIIANLLPEKCVGLEQLNVLRQSQIEQSYLETNEEVEKLNQELQNQANERTKAEEKAMENDAMLRNVISSAIDAIITINNKGEILRWNYAAEETFGYPEREMLGENLTAVLIPTEYRHVHNNKSFHQFLSNWHPKMLNKRIELMAVKKDGAVIPVEIAVTAIAYKHETYFNAFIRNISVRKRREEEIIAMKEKAEQASHAKSEFLSIMSHEIRTPLNSVIGFAELLLKNNPRQDQAEYLNILKFSGEHLLNLVNDILDFNKLDAGKIELEQSAFNLEVLVTNLYKSFLPGAVEKDIQLIKEYDGSIPQGLRGDSLRFNQVLNNLVGNAIKFTQKGSVTISVKLQEVVNDHAIINFRITDSGIGIPQNKLEKIFELFTQVDNTTSRQYGGTGLGLNIAQKIVKAMGGDLKVKSLCGQGSEFYFTIKLSKAVLSETKHYIEQPDEKNDRPLENKKILLAEDHKANGMLAKQFLSKWGAEVYVAENGGEVLQFMEKMTFDIILMDLQMPLIDGYDCTRIIRKKYNELPILALTASKGDEIEKKVYEAGMNDIIGKPFKPKELKEKLITYLSL
ncbi:MAG: ATP-binding protein, partial [Panacibacter sp.]